MKKFNKLFLLVLVIIIFSLNSTNTFAWGIKTHKYIVDKGFSIFENDYHNYLHPLSTDPNFERLSSYKKIVIENSVTPDSIAFGVVVNKDGYDMTARHTHCIEKDNRFSAEKQVQRFVSRALSEWAAGNYSDSAKFLGYALHFYGDLNNSFHAANVKFYDPPISGHGDYELHTDKNLQKYSVPTTISTNPDLVYNTYANTFNNFNDINSFLYHLTWDDILVARNYFYSDARKFHQYGHYAIAAENTLPRAEKGIALILYRFLEEVNVANKLTLKVITSNDPGAGTSEDNYVNLKLHFKNGSERIIVLGHLNSNDFSKGSLGIYDTFIYGKDYDLYDIDEIYLQKEGSDNWKVASVDILINNQIAFSWNLNLWLRKASDVITLFNH